MMMTKEQFDALEIGDRVWTIERSESSIFSEHFYYDIHWWQVMAIFRDERNDNRSRIYCGDKAFTRYEVFHTGVEAREALIERLQKLVTRTQLSIEEHKSWLEVDKQRLETIA